MIQCLGDTSTVHRETDFINDLKINSANLVDVVLDVEDEFDIQCLSFKFRIILKTILEQTMEWPTEDPSYCKVLLFNKQKRNRTVYPYILEEKTIFLESIQIFSNSKTTILLTTIDHDIFKKLKLKNFDIKFCSYIDWSIINRNILKIVTKILSVSFSNKFNINHSFVNGFVFEIVIFQERNIHLTWYCPIFLIISKFIYEE